MIQLLGGFGMALPQQQPASLPIELRGEPALPRPFDELQRLFQPGRAFFDLTCDLICPGSRRAIYKGIHAVAQWHSKRSNRHAEDTGPRSHRHSWP
jgi:hypothetical protein